jgi:hypothetical protein
MELTIDGRLCDLGGERIIAPEYAAAKLADPEAAREGHSLRITIPPTPANDELADFARDPHTAARFNAELHTTRLSVEGATIISGTVRLLGASNEGYLLEIRDGGAGWAKNAAHRMLNTLCIDYQATLTPATVLASWTDDSPVKFFPVIRDEYPRQNSSSDLLPAERLLTVDDYHPFLHIATLTRAIFAEAGYRIESRFMESEWFRSLYMSGAYRSRDTTALASRMGFFARRLSPVTASADYSGRVTANPKDVAGTVGNFVETATPQSIDSDGEPIPELHNNGRCFGLENGKIVFTPTSAVSAGFECYIKYTTDHRILTRDRLRGFDTIGLDENTLMQFTLANRYKDRRGGIVSNYRYLAIVFDHTEGARYRLTYTYNGAAGTLWTEFADRTAHAATPASGAVENPVLLVYENSNWVPYAKDWALYDGYIAETGQTTVEVRVRTAAEHIGPSSPRYFNLMFFQGAEAGMSLTLHKECSLQPHFSSAPGFGSVIRFDDVARHRVRQIVLLEALQHLFNLRFHTEEATKTVRVEPADDFFGSGPVADWRAKSDFSQPVLLADIAPEVHEHRTWGYLAGDGAVTRFDAEAESPLGEWSAATDSYAAKEGEKELRSPLFCPTLNTTGHYANAPAASIMQVGDRDDTLQDGANFTPRIVSYAGMHPLPEGQRWGYPSGGQEYPLAAFLFAGDDTSEGFSLCFEDRGGVPGLHRYYDRQLALESAGQRIDLSVQLAPHEFETLFTPGTGAPDLRSVFLLDSGQEPVRATLHAIEEYDPEAASVRCTFTRSPQ